MRNAMKTGLLSVLLSLTACAGNTGNTDKTMKNHQEDTFVRIEGQDLIKPDGSKLFIQGTNLGNWLNPEGYMFGFSKTNSAHFIHDPGRGSGVKPRSQGRPEMQEHFRAGPLLLPVRSSLRPHD